jgi:hypothetical protein
LYTPTAIANPSVNESSFSPYVTLRQPTYVADNAVTRSASLLDVAIAVAVAIMVLIIAPGWAVVAIVAVAVLLVVGVSFGVTGWRGRRARHRSPQIPRSRSASRR